jgi:thymidylate kinase
MTLSEKVNKPKLVIFEGADKVGKGTLYLAYRKATRFGPLAIDRFTGSNWVYDQVYKRETDLEAYLESERFIQEIYDCYLVYLTASAHIIEQRIRAQEKGIELTRAIANFAQADALFLEYFLTKTKFRKAKMINTGTCTTEQALEDILLLTGERGIQNVFDINT